MPLARSGAQDDVIVGTLFITYKSWGWSEKYYINSPDGAATIVPTLENASNQLAELTRKRLFLLGNNTQIIWSRVTSKRNPRLSVPGSNQIEVPALIDAETTIEKLNDPQSGWAFRFDDLAGNHMVRNFRGVRDSWITDALKADTIPIDLPVTSGAVTFRATGLHGADAGKYAAQDAFYNFMNYLKLNTVGLLGKKNLANQFVTYPLSNIAFRGYGSRDTGRPFGQSRGRAAARV